MIYLYFQPLQKKKGEFVMNKKNELRKFIHTSLIIAIVVVLSNFNYYVPMGGESGLKLGLTTFFVKLPALIFGPLYGALAGGVCDFLGFIVKPMGPYMFPLTLTALFGGLLIGFLWKLFKKINSETVKDIFKIAALLCILFGAVNHILIHFYEGLNYSQFLLSLGKRTVYFTVWFEAAGFLFFGVLLIDRISHLILKERYNEDFIKLLLTLIIPNLIVTTINTFILMFYYPSLAKLGFLIVFIPRLTEEIIMTVLQSFMLSYLIKIYAKISGE